MFCPRCNRQFGKSRLYCLDCGIRLVRTVSLDVYNFKETKQVGAILGERYELHGFLGKGATARVYLAEDIRTRQAVAVKVLTAASEETRRRFVVEGKAALRIDHPNVVRVLDVGERADGMPYLVTEILQGETMGDYVRRQGRLPVDLMLTLIRQAATGLAAAHRAGVIHRDLKPDNLFLVGERGEPFGLKVIDFGLAKLDQQTGTSSERVVVGTIEYMAPEQVLADPVDVRTDVYGLGAVMFRAVTGQLPFDSKHDMDLLAHQLFSPTPPPSWLHAEVDPRIERMILTATRKHPDNRYQTMDAFLADIERILGVRPGEPIGAEIAVPDRYEPKTELGLKTARVLAQKLAPE